MSFDRPALAGDRTAARRSVRISLPAGCSGGRRRATWPIRTWSFSWRRPSRAPGFRARCRRYGSSRSASALLAVCGPHLTLPLPARDGRVFLCIDTSGSMASTDVAPTRAEAAKAAARAFIGETPAGTKIGIIAFSGAAGVVQPLSADRTQVSQALDDLPLPNGATAIGDALQTGGAKLSRARSPRHHSHHRRREQRRRRPGRDRAVAGRAPHSGVRRRHRNARRADSFREPTTRRRSTKTRCGVREASGGAYARAENATQLRDALARLGRITALERQSVNASLGFALAGAFGMLVAFLAGFGLGRYP